MDFYHFLQLLKKDFWYLLVSILIIIGGVFAYNIKTKTTYEGVIGFSIVRFGQENLSEFNDYYATQADNLVTANFAKWLTSKAFIANAYKDAGKDLNNINIDSQIRSIKATKVSGTDINFIYQGENQDTVEKVGETVIKLVNQRSEQIKKSNPKSGNLRGLEVSSDLKTYQKSINQTLNYLLGGLAGLLIGLIIILTKNYVTSRKK